MNTRLQYQLSALDRCIESQRAFAREVEKANPSDAYAALMIHEDIGQLDALHARLAVVGAALSAADAVRDGSASGAVDAPDYEYRHLSLPGSDGQRVWLEWQRFGNEMQIRPIAARLAQQPAETACKDCNGDGKQCFAGHSAHPSNWHKCETCGGTGNAQQPAAAEYTPGDYGMEVGATTHTPATAGADMDEFLHALSVFSTNAVAYGQRMTDANLCDVIEQRMKLSELYAQALASNAGVPEPRASAWRQALLGYWGLGLDDIAFLEQRALNIERMKGGGE